LVPESMNFLEAIGYVWGRADNEWCFEAELE
jgi:hypothetical protein